MKRKGFTLVELLAVIAILAILVIIALPNVMGMFNTAKENSFKTEVKEIYKTAQQEWIQDSMYNTEEQVYSRCSTCTGKSLDLSGRSELDYYIKLNKSGKVVEYYATDGTFQYSFNDPDGLEIEKIDGIEKVADLNSNQIINISDSDSLLPGYSNAVEYLMSKVDNCGSYIDNHGDLRYKGTNPCNYVTFNNEVSGWRIIGIFNGRVKIVRKNSLGSFAWDSSPASVNTGSGINEWSQADIMIELNGDYLNTSLSSNTNWYNGSNNALGDGNFNKDYVLKTEAQKLIGDETWYLGGFPMNGHISLEEIYNYERGTKHWPTPNDGIVRTNEWTGKVGLIYPSDFGYASDNSNCSTNASYSNNFCNNNWMANYGWTITTCSDSTYHSVDASSSFVNSSVSINKFAIRPTVYLVSGVQIKGSGTTEDPYEFAK